MKFRHKPIEVYAVQWMKQRDHPAETEPNPMQMQRTALMINTGVSGTKDVHQGDFIVSFSDGTHDVLSSEQFHALYEPVPQAVHQFHYGEF